MGLCLKKAGCSGRSLFFYFWSFTFLLVCKTDTKAGVLTAILVQEVILRMKFRDLPGGPVTKIQCSQGMGPRFDGELGN